MEEEGVGFSWGSLRCLITFVITVLPRTTPKKESHIATPVNVFAGRGGGGFLAPFTGKESGIEKSSVLWHV